MNPGIPTVYQGIRFRSRLEAKWAVFFDMLGIRWEYEPLDLDGWIPDFALISEDATTNALVEVKPEFDTEWLSDAFRKAMRARPTSRIFVVGATPLIENTTFPPQEWGTIVGISGLYPDDEQHPLGLMRCAACSSAGLGTSAGLCACGGDIVPMETEAIRQGWAFACNKTQWRGKGS